MGPEGTNNAKTLLRRAQRKHSQQSYLAMKNKLLSLVRPLPKAIYVSDLELFRADLFTKAQDFPEQPEEKPIEALDQTPMKDRCISDSVTCGWCGTWVPLPTFLATPSVPVSNDMPNHKVLEKDAIIEADGVVFLGHPGAGDDCSDPVVERGEGESNTFSCQLGFADGLGANNIYIEAIIPKVSYIPDMFEYLTGAPMLCEVVSLMRGERLAKNMTNVLGASVQLHLELDR